MAWEIDSHEFHLSPADHAATLARRSAMMAAGILVVATAPSRITREPATVLAELERTHAQAALRPRPRLYALTEGSDQRRVRRIGSDQRAVRRKEARYAPTSISAP
jgi:hypothetical protein